MFPIALSGPVALALGLITLIALTAVYTRDAGRRATALVVLRLLLRRRTDPHDHSFGSDGSGGDGSGGDNHEGRHEDEDEEQCPAQGSEHAHSDRERRTPPSTADRIADQDAGEHTDL